MYTEIYTPTFVTRTKQQAMGDRLDEKDSLEEGALKSLKTVSVFLRYEKIQTKQKRKKQRKKTKGDEN